MSGAVFSAIDQSPFILLEAGTRAGSQDEHGPGLTMMQHEELISTTEFFYGWNK
jgi:hypothetical protein